MREKIAERITEYGLDIASDFFINSEKEEAERIADLILADLATPEGVRELLKNLAFVKGLQEAGYVRLADDQTLPYLPSDRLYHGVYVKNWKNIHINNGMNTLVEEGWRKVVEPITEKENNGR